MGRKLVKKWPNLLIRKNKKKVRLNKVDKFLNKINNKYNYHKVKI
jgi:hypothetical protein